MLTQTQDLQPNLGEEHTKSEPDCFAQLFHWTHSLLAVVQTAAQCQSCLNLTDTDSDTSIDPRLSPFPLGVSGMYFAFPPFVGQRYSSKIITPMYSGSGLQWHPTPPRTAPLTAEATAATGRHATTIRWGAAAAKLRLLLTAPPVLVSKEPSTSLLWPRKSPAMIRVTQVIASVLDAFGSSALRTRTGTQRSTSQSTPRRPDAVERVRIQNEEIEHARVRIRRRRYEEGRGRKEDAEVGEPGCMHGYSWGETCPR